MMKFKVGISWDEFVKEADRTELQEAIKSGKIDAILNQFKEDLSKAISGGLNKEIQHLQVSVDLVDETLDKECYDCGCGYNTLYEPECPQCKSWASV